MIQGAITILIVDDDAGDVDLTREVLEDAKIVLNINAVPDGVEAMAYLRQQGDYLLAPRPDLIFLDLNMPRKDGREVLQELKQDKDLCHIPVVLLTTSDDEADIYRAYNLGTNCYVTKPVGLAQFSQVLRYLEDFWFMVVKLPSALPAGAAR